MTDESSAIHPQAVSDAFGLGPVHGALSPVTGGLTHRMWRLETERGAFAVKELALDEGTWTAARIERAFTVERAAFEAGVAMPRAIENPRTGGCLAEIDKRDGTTATVRVHEWLNGEGLRRIVYGAEHAARTAAVIARIHGLGMAGGETLAEALRPFGEAHWLALVEEVERSQVEWRWELRGLLPVVRELEAYVESAHGDATPLIMGHRDADQKNWMKTPGGELLLVDWDAAGPVRPRHEVANLALTWAGVHLGEPDWKVVRAWIGAYREAGGELERILPGDLAEFVAVSVGWFENNVRRAMGADDGDGGGEQAALAAGVVRRGFKELPRVLRSIERWERVLEEE